MAIYNYCAYKWYVHFLCSLWSIIDALLNNIYSFVPIFVRSGISSIILPQWWHQRVFGYFERICSHCQVMRFFFTVWKAVKIIMCLCCHAIWLIFKLYACIEMFSSFGSVHTWSSLAFCIDKSRIRYNQAAYARIVGTKWVISTNKLE